MVSPWSVCQSVRVLYFDLHSSMWLHCDPITTATSRLMKRALHCLTNRFIVVRLPISICVPERFKLTSFQSSIGTVILHQVSHAQRLTCDRWRQVSIVRGLYFWLPAPINLLCAILHISACYQITGRMEKSSPTHTFTDFLQAEGFNSIQLTALVHCSRSNARILCCQFSQAQLFTILGISPSFQSTAESFTLFLTMHRL